MAIERAKNNFDVIRLAAAVLVIYGHFFGQCGRIDPLYQFTGSWTCGELAVDIFFIISGYLIAGSWLGRPELPVYFEKRILRIYPALIFVLFLSVFLFGPLLTTLSLNEYFTNTSTYTYFQNLTLWKMQYALPGVMVHGKEAVFNAPLWTLFFEFLMYILLAFFGLFGILKKESGKIYLIWILFIVFLILYINGVPRELFILKISASAFTRFFVYFFSGTLYFYYLRDKKLNGFVVALLIVSTILSRGTFIFNFLALLTITASVFWFAFLNYHPLRFIVSRGDFSYGIYLYGHIVQNFLENYFDCNLPLYIKFPLSLVLTFPFAYISWRFIESKALKLKLSL